MAGDRCGALAAATTVAGAVPRFRRSDLPRRRRAGLSPGPVRAVRRAATGYRWTALSLCRCVLHLGRPRFDLRTACDRRSDRAHAIGPADRRPDHRALSRGPHHDCARRIDRTCVRRLRPAAVVGCHAIGEMIEEGGNGRQVLSVDCASTACTATLATCCSASRSEPDDAITPMPTETAET